MNRRDRPSGLTQAQEGSEAVEAMICTQPEPPKFDALPTYKITCYPLEKRDYRPFAQAQVCRTPEAFSVRLWAFEAFPRPCSRVEAVFAAAKGGGLLRVTGWADGRWSVRVCPSGGEERDIAAAAHPMAGDDFQGEYWGFSVGIPLKEAEEALGVPLEIGAVVPGNFYKRSDDPEKPHHGSCWPADFAGGREYAASSLVPFTVVRY